MLHIICTELNWWIPFVCWLCRSVLVVVVIVVVIFTLLSKYLTGKGANNI